MSVSKEIALKDISVAQYDSLLLETAGPGVSEERVVLAFRVLDSLLPQLGTFSPVLTKIRHQLYDAVFSEQYTGTQPDGTADNFVERIPFFTLVKRVYDQRDETAESLNEQLEIVKRKLFEKQQDFEDSRGKIATLEMEVENCQLQAESHESDLLDKKAEILGLESTLNQEREAMDRMEYQMSCDISDLKEDLEASQQEADYLRTFKQGYDKLEAAFHGQAALDDTFARKKKQPVVATKRAHLKSSVDSAMKLEEQILTVQNATIEEFDTFLEEHKRALRGPAAPDDETALVEEHEHIDTADQQLQVMEDRFLMSMGDTQQELELLRQHRALLQEQLHVLEENKPSVPKKSRKLQSRDVLRVESRPMTQESSLSAGLEAEEGEEDPSADPFIVQERIFSKYAAMLYTSDNNGRTFHEFKDAKFCPSCGEKTSLCPHKLLTQEHVFTLTPGCTHLKVARPKVRINLEAMENLRQTGMTDIAVDTISFSPDSKKGAFMDSAMSMSGGDMSGGEMSQSGEEMSIGERSDGDQMAAEQESAAGTSNASEVLETPGFPVDSQMIHSMQKLWEDYKSRSGLERAVPRSLSQERVLSMLDQFAAYMLWQDEFDPEQEGSCSIMDSLYNFLGERYMTTQVMYMAAHDLIAALVEHSGMSKIIQLFSHVLIGNFDGAVFRYFLLICDFIDLVDWKAVDDFRAFASAVYPFLNEDDLETLHMGYTAYSENRISKHLVAEYFVYIILKLREPRFLEMEAKLMTHPGREVGQLTEPEFVEAVEAVLAVPNEKLKKRLFEESLMAVQAKDDDEDALPLARLAQITSYLGLLQIVHVVKETVIEKVGAARERPGSARSTTTRSSDSDGDGQLLTMTRAKVLGQNIARRKLCRNARMAEFED